MKNLLCEVAVKDALCDLRELTNILALVVTDDVLAPDTVNLVANNNSDDQVSIDGYKA